jgi:hypothetical protein
MSKQNPCLQEASWEINTEAHCQSNHQKKKNTSNGTSPGPAYNMNKWSIIHDLTHYIKKML